MRLKAAQGLATGLVKMPGGAAVKPAEVKVAAKVARPAPKPMPPRPSVLGRGGEVIFSRISSLPRPRDLS